MTASPPPRLPHRWAVGLGVVLLLPELVLAVVVVKQPIVVGLAGFAMTLGFLRFGLLGYRVLRERRPPAGRGALFTAGFVATVAGALLYSRVAAAVATSADERFTGVVAPPGAVALNLVVILVLGLWAVGIVFALAAIVGAVRARR